MKLVFTLLLFILLTPLYAQQLEWAVGNACSPGYVDYNIPDRVVTTDGNGNVYVVGSFRQAMDIDPGVGTDIVVPAGNLGSADIFIQKLSSDGTLIWAKTMGDVSTEHVRGITLDSDENIYLVGEFVGGTDLDPGVDTFAVVTNGNLDIFVQKLDSNGNFLWGTSTGGTGIDGARGITVDSDDNVYIIGHFYNLVDFDPSAGVYNLFGRGYKNLFIQKLSPTGNLQWVKTFIGGRDKEINSIVLDAQDNIYTTGTFAGIVDFDPGLGGYLLNSFDNAQYIHKMNVNGVLDWVRMIPGCAPTGIQVDNQNNVYTIGNFGGTVDFDAGVGTYNLTSTSWIDAFVNKLNPQGDFVWATRIGAAVYPTHSRGLATDQQGNVITTGSFRGKIDLNPGLDSFCVTEVRRTGYLQKLDSNGQFLHAFTFAGGNYSDVHGIVLDAQENIITIGEYSSGTDFNPTHRIDTIADPFQGLFIQKLNSCPLVSHVETITSTSNNYTWIDGITYTSSNNTATHAIIGGASNGCDSIIQLNLTLPSSIARSPTSIGRLGMLPPASPSSKEPILNKLSSKHEIQLYPIPADDHVIISLPSLGSYFILEILDINGRSLMTKKYKDRQQVVVPITDLPTGVYYLKVNTEAGMETLKMIKQ